MSVKYLSWDEKGKRTELFASWNTNMYHSGSSRVVTGWGKFWKQHLLVSDWHIENPSENLANISSSLPILNLSRLDLDKKKIQIINKLINYSVYVPNLVSTANTAIRVITIEMRNSQMKNLLSTFAASTHSSRSSSVLSCSLTLSARILTARDSAIGSSDFFSCNAAR